MKPHVDIEDREESAIKTRYGPILGFRDDLVCQFLRLYGEWAHFETMFLSSVLAPNSAVYDIGGYLGTFSFGLMDNSPSFVLAVEPNPETFSRLKTNFERNSKVPFAVMNSAVGLSHGQTIGAFAQSGNFGSFSLISDNLLNVDARSVSICTLEDLREKFGPYHLLKLDVEGGESNIIRSDYDWIAKNTPLMWMECNDSPSSLGLFHLLNTFDVDIYFYRYPAFNPRNFNNTSQRIFPVAFEAGLLAVPKETPVRCPSDAAESGASCVKVNSVEMLRRLLWLTPRWGRSEWANLSRTELLAICSHLDAKESYSGYLGGMDI
jgi:FkbM family methyltransferase